MEGPRACCDKGGGEDDGPSKENGDVERAWLLLSLLLFNIGSFFIRVGGGGKDVNEHKPIKRKKCNVLNLVILVFFLKTTYAVI